MALRAVVSSNLTEKITEQNSKKVFTDVFRDLEEAMDHFFTALYQRMFTVLNAQFRFDDK